MELRDQSAGMRNREVEVPLRKGPCPPKDFFAATAIFQSTTCIHSYSIHTLSIMASISAPTLLATYQSSHASSSKDRHVSLAPVYGSQGELAVLAVQGDGVWTYDVGTQCHHGEVPS